MEINKIIQDLQGFGLKVSENQAKLLVELMDLTLAKNEVMNLTAIRDRNEFIDKMIEDSALTFCMYFKDEKLLENKRVLDIGTGAGFPGLVLSILYPNTNFVLLDSTSKKIKHVNETISKLNLKNVIGISARAEEYVKKENEKFDFVTARAVSDIFMLTELASGYVKIGGYFVALKTQNETIDKEKLNSNAKKLSLKINEYCPYNLSDNAGERYNIYYEKIKPLNKKYPREYKDIKAKPLY